MTHYTQLTPQEILRFAVNINPGEWLVEDTLPISTLLGSCVAVCLYDDGVPIAGMNHFLVPTISPHRYACAAQPDRFLAGDACLEALLEALLERGAARHRVRAKAFGGGMVIQTKHANAQSIGQMNVEFTKTWLDRENIPLIASDFLGNFSRKILLLPQNGDVYCKRMPSNMMDTKTFMKQAKVSEALI